MRNIKLTLGNGYTFSMSQDVGAGSAYMHHVEVALFKDDQFVNTSVWLHEHLGHEAAWACDDVQGYVDAESLPNTLKKAKDYADQA
tara:strand:- start:133 stop:390 length:258 start_codon:yes stop_codon:yes gene_type:complete